MKKIERAQRLIHIHESLFKCPVCASSMHIKATSLTCLNRHSFDLSKTGSIHLLRTPVKQAKYDHTLFKARHAVFEQGLYEKMIEELSLIIREYLPKKDQIRMLDAGCGEGSFLASLIENLSTFGYILGVGIDLAKEGIRLASKNYPGHIWCVADLAHCPFQDHSFDLILNILSPSKYAEFSRLLQNGGSLIKVVPESDYLKELREELYQGREKKTYSNEKVITHFSNHFRIVDQKRIQYTEKVDHLYLENILQMTPMSWGAEKNRIQKIMASNIDAVTIDLTVIIGKPKT